VGLCSSNSSRAIRGATLAVGRGLEAATTLAVDDGEELNRAAGNQSAIDGRRARRARRSKWRTLVVMKHDGAKEQSER